MTDHTVPPIGMRMIKTAAAVLICLLVSMAVDREDMRIYSSIAAAVGSLKGPRHGGANSKVMAMMDDVKEHVRDWNDEGCVADYLTRILNKDAFDRSGLICAVYENYAYLLG